MDFMSKFSREEALNRANVPLSERRGARLVNSVELSDGRVSELWAVGVAADGTDVSVMMQTRYPDGRVKVLSPF